MRTSFTFAGSEDARATERLGLIGRMDGVMGGLLAEIEEGGMASSPWPPFRAPTLGVSNLTIARFLHVLKKLPQPRRDPTEGDSGRVLDTQIEAQVHGPIDLRRDVELLVADPAFAATATGAILRELALRAGTPRHAGSRCEKSDFLNPLPGTEPDVCSYWTSTMLIVLSGLQDTRVARGHDRGAAA
jgi:hypothetical protein